MARSSRLESGFQDKLKDTLKELFPGCMIFKMDQIQGIPDLLVLYKNKWASLENKKTDWETELETEQWLALFQMAEIHNVLPLIYDAVYSCPAARKTEGDFFAPVKRRTLQMVMMQTQKTSEFLRLYEKLKEAGYADK